MDEKQTILYVDDEPINLQLFEINMKRKFHVLTAESPQEAIEKFNEHPDIKVTLSDMQMPDVSGIELIKQIKRVSPEHPCYIVSGFARSNEISEAIQARLIDDYFGKPIDYEAICEAINEV